MAWSAPAVSCHSHTSVQISAGDHRIGFNLYQHFRRYERAHLNHRGRRTNIVEKLSVRLAKFFPVRDVDDEHPRAHHVLQGCARLLQSSLNVLQSLNCLGIRVADSNDLAVCARGRGSGHIDLCAHFDSTRVTHNRLPRYAAGDVPSIHECLQYYFQCRKAEISSQPRSLTTSAWGNPVLVLIL